MGNLATLCRPIRVLLSDVDGVLTDGSIFLDDQGREIKRFHVRDGSAIKLWQAAGHTFGLISGRSSPAVEHRARELGIVHVGQGVKDKLAHAEALLERIGAAPQEAAYVGDDLPDLEMMRWAGLGVAVGDAVRELRVAAKYVTESPGGRGAVREVIEMLLKAQGKWEELTETK